MDESGPRWVWQTPEWPAFRYDRDALSASLGQARVQQGVLMGKSAALGAHALPLPPRAVGGDEAGATAAIEGESLNIEAVRSSAARRLGLTSTLAAAVPSNVEGQLDVMEDAA